MAEKEKEEQASTKVRFHHTKSGLFRVVHADGLTGSITPRGDLFICFYSERLPIPDSVVVEISPEGELIREVKEESITTTKGIVREMEVGVVMDVANAKSMLGWLRHMTKQLEKQFQEIKEEG